MLVCTEQLLHSSSDCLPLLAKVSRHISDDITLFNVWLDPLSVEHAHRNMRQAGGFISQRLMQSVAEMNGN